MAREVVVRAEELKGRMNDRFVQDAAVKKITLSAFLEEFDPTPAGEEMSAFERQLEVHDIVTASNERMGLNADPMSRFEESISAEVLGAEYLARQYRSVSGRHGSKRSPITTDFSGVAAELRPIVIEADRGELTPAVPLSELIAFTTTVVGDSFRAMYVMSQPEKAGKVRVGQATPLPEAILELGSRSIDLFKFGRAIVISYEALRSLPIDTVAAYVRMAAIQSQMDKVADVVDVAINGDGNDGTTLTTYNLTALDPATTANNLTFKALQAFKLKFDQPYVANTMLMDEANYIKMMFLPVADNGEGFLYQIPAGSFGSFVPMNASAAVTTRVASLDDVPSNLIIGFDNRFAFQHIVESGSQIAETMRWIRNQTQELTFSENEAFAKIHPLAVKAIKLDS